MSFLYIKTSKQHCGTATPSVRAHGRPTLTVRRSELKGVEAGRRRCHPLALSFETNSPVVSCVSNLYMIIVLIGDMKPSKDAFMIGGWLRSALSRLFGSVYVRVRPRNVILFEEMVN